MMSHGIAGWTAEQKLPMLLDLEPYVPANKNSPRDAARLLVERTQKAHPGIKFHIIMDSGFGSFDEMDHFCSNGVLATMSLSSNQWEWAFDLLGYCCPLDAGRTALVTLPNSQSKALASIFHVKSDSGKLIDIRTLSSAFTYQIPEVSESTVVRVGTRRKSKDGYFLYETVWAGGETTLEPATAFMDEDGTFNVFWLKAATVEDIMEALGTLTTAKLQLICDAQSLKVCLPN